jgi:hypothetical protein
VSIEAQIAAWRIAAARGLPFAFHGQGLSMWPTLRPGDEALFAPLAGTPRLGEILLCAAGDRLVAHRLVAHDGARLILRGDARAEADPPVGREAVLGRLVGVRRLGRELSPDAATLRALAVLVPLLHDRAPRLLKLVALTLHRTAASVSGDGKWGGNPG